MSVDQLVRMANQIGKFFRARAPKAVASMTDHLRKFWDPRMRDAILAHVDPGGAGLDPDVREAIATLQQEQVHRAAS